MITRWRLAHTRHTNAHAQLSRFHFRVGVCCHTILYIIFVIAVPDCVCVCAPLHATFIFIYFFRKLTTVWRQQQLATFNPCAIRCASYTPNNDSEIGIRLQMITIFIFFFLPLPHTSCRVLLSIVSVNCFERSDMKNSEEKKWILFVIPHTAHQWHISISSVNVFAAATAAAAVAKTKQRWSHLNAENSWQNHCIFIVVVDGRSHRFMSS